MSLIALLIASSTALATDSVTVSPAPVALPQNGIEIVRLSADAPDQATMAFVLTCVDDGEPLVNALAARSDVGTLVVARNPTAADLRTWMMNERSSDLGSYRLALIVVACRGEGGDTDEEILVLPNDDPFPFVDLVTGMRSMATSSVWIIDTSRRSFGATADDVRKLGATDALAISSGPPGTMAESGLLEAVADVITASNGAPLTLDALFYKGIKQKLAGTDLNVHTSMGLSPEDEWNGNRARLVLPGGPLIEPEPAPFIPPAIPLTDPNVRKPVPAGCWVAGAGLLTAMGGGINFGIAAGDQSWIASVNEGSIDATDAELNAGVRHMRTHAAIGGILTSIGGAALVGGTAWTALTVRPTTQGIEIGGTFSF